MTAKSRRLEDRLRRGLRGKSSAGRNDDAEVARETVRELALAAFAEFDRERSRTFRAESESRAFGPHPNSFLSRFTVRPEGDAPAIESLSDGTTLLGILRGGSLVQRRAAALRIAHLLREGAFEGDESTLERIESALVHSRDAEIAFEVQRARAALPGEAGEEARDDEDAWGPLVEALDADIARFWEGELDHEPFAALEGEERSWIGLRFRLLPDRIAMHLSAILERCDGASTDRERTMLLDLVRFAGDPRLVPSLIFMLDSRKPVWASRAARALARSEDPRVLPALREAYERSVVAAERATIAGALGIAGDARGAGYVRKLLREDDARARLAAAEAMESLASLEDVELLVSLLSRNDDALVLFAVRALARLGDGRALPELRRLEATSELRGGMRAEVADACLAVQAQLELRGEEAPSAPEPSSKLAETRQSVLARRPDDSFATRALGRIDFFLGSLFLMIGAVSRAVAWFELAAARRRRWALPLAAIAMAYARADEAARALGAFRRAIEADRHAIERDKTVVRTFAQVVLRRVDEVERQGKLDVARGLLDEILDLDLRRAPGKLVLELRRRRRSLSRTTSEFSP